MIFFLFQIDLIAKPRTKDGKQNNGRYRSSWKETWILVCRNFALWIDRIVCFARFSAFPQAIRFANGCLPQTECTILGATSVQFAIRWETNCVHWPKVTLEWFYIETRENEHKYNEQPFFSALNNGQMNEWRRYQFRCRWCNRICTF